MALVNLTEAAKMVGMSRVTLNEHLKNGKLSYTHDSEGKRRIDTAELIRVYGDRIKTNVHNEQANVQVGHGNTREKLSLYELEVKLLREQLSDAKDQIRKTEEREQRLLDQVDKLTDTIKQIEHKPAGAPVVEVSTPDAIVPAAAVPDQEVIVPAAPPKRSFWSKIFGG